MTDQYVQTRNEAGGLTYHVSIASAMKMAEIDRTIWKISWTDATTGERIRLARDLTSVRDEFGVTTIDAGWFYEPLDANGKELMEPFEEIPLTPK